MGRFFAKHFITARRAPTAVTVRVSWDIGLFLFVYDLDIVADRDLLVNRHICMGFKDVLFWYQ
jgi:hypothetical protein